MTRQLTGKRVAILATDGVELMELAEPMKALRNAGAAVEVVAPHGGQIQGVNHHEKGDKIEVDCVLASARPASYDAVVLPGGVANPDALRMNEDAVAFARHFHDTKKPIAVICHGPWTLIVKGREMTSWPSLKTDLINAGARWVDREVVVDEGIVGSRKPDDLPAFCKKMVEEFAEGRHQHQAMVIERMGDNAEQIGRVVGEIMQRPRNPHFELRDLIHWLVSGRVSADLGLGAPSARTTRGTLPPPLYIRIEIPDLLDTALN